MAALISDRDLAFLIVEALQECGGTATWRNLERHPKVESLSESEYMEALNAAFDRGFVSIADSGTTLELTAKRHQPVKRHQLAR